MANYHKSVEMAYQQRTQFILVALTGRTGVGCTTTASILKKSLSDLDLQSPKYKEFNTVTERKETRDDDIDALFVSKFRKRLTKSGIEERVKAVGERAGVKNVFPHRFRHTFATNLIRSGMPIQEVAVLMGHSQIDTTKVYAHTNQDRVKLSYLRYS